MSLSKKAARAILPNAALKKLPLSARKLCASLATTAMQFSDYNFRTYFVDHVRDDFLEASQKKLSGPDLKAFMERREEDLRKMKRMVEINCMFARHPVIVDERIQGTRGAAITRQAPQRAREAEEEGDKESQQKA